MKAFIDKVFKMKKIKKDVIEAKATEAMVESIVAEVKKSIAEEPVVEKQVTKEEIYSKPGHYFADCNCFKCLRWRRQNA